MASLLRTTSTRILPRTYRCFATGSSSDSTTISDAFASIGISASPPPQTPSPTPTAQTVIEIPPEEDPLLRYLTSSILKHGRRAKASRITTRTLLHIHAFTRAPPMPILRQAIMDASPAVRTLMHRKGAKTIPRPIAIGEKERTRFAVKWILKECENKSGRTLEERLAQEIIAVVQGSSKVLDKKKEVHQFAMVNRGNAAKSRGP